MAASLFRLTSQAQEKEQFIKQITNHSLFLNEVAALQPPALLKKEKIRAGL